MQKTRTIKRDGQFAAAVEELEAVIPDITQKVLSGDIVKKGVIKSLKSQNLTQEKIGERIGWTQEQVSRHQTINEVIMPDILKMALEHQKGRGIDEYAQGHNFTERWFRDSGLYELNSEYQASNGPRQNRASLLRGRRYNRIKARVQSPLGHFVTKVENQRGKMSL